MPDIVLPEIVVDYLKDLESCNNLLSKAAEIIRPAISRGSITPDEADEILDALEEILNDPHASCYDLDKLASRIWQDIHDLEERRKISGNGKIFFDDQTQLSEPVKAALIIGGAILLTGLLNA